MRRRQFARLACLLFFGIVVQPGFTDWDNPVNGEWPDVVCDSDAPGKSVDDLLGEIKLKAEADGQTAVSAAATNRKQFPFVDGNGAQIPSSHAWARVLVAYRVAQEAETAAAVDKPPLWTRVDDTLRGPNGQEPNWGASITASPAGSARHYVNQVYSKANAGPPFGAGPWKQSINGQIDRVKHLSSGTPQHNQTRLAHVYAAYVSAAYGQEWEACFQELEHCNG